MTKVVIEKLVWDEWNRLHVKKHKISEEEILEAGKNIIYHRHTYSGRYLAIGRSGERLIAMVFYRKGKKEYYLVTARDASKKERRDIYEKER